MLWQKVARLAGWVMKQVIKVNTRKLSLQAAAQPSTHYYTLRTAHKIMELPFTLYSPKNPRDLTTPSADTRSEDCQTFFEM